MGRNLVPNSDGIKAMIELEVGVKTSEVAEAVFRNKIEEVKKDIKREVEGKISNLIYGGIIATSLVLIVIIVDNHLFLAGYNQHYLDAEKSFSQEIRNLRKESSDDVASCQREIVQTKERQDYLERLLLQKANVTITSPIKQ